MGLKESWTQYLMFVLHTIKDDEDEQVNFKGNAKAFVRTYGFRAIYHMGTEWERLALFLNLLIQNCRHQRRRFVKGILESIDLDSYRAEIKQTMSIILG